MTPPEYAESGLLARSIELQAADIADAAHEALLRTAAKYRAAQTLANLLLRYSAAPEVSIWCIEEDGELIAGQLAAYSLDSTRVALHQWAVILGDSVWELKPHTSRGVRAMGRIDVRGTWLGHRVMIWSHIDLPDGVDPDVLLAELSAPYTVDSTGEGTAEPNSFSQAQSADNDKAAF